MFSMAIKTRYLGNFYSNFFTIILHKNKTPKLIHINLLWDFQILDMNISSGRWSVKHL